MRTSFRFFAALAASALLSVAALAQPVRSNPPAKRPAAGQQQTAPTKTQPLALASARPAELAAPAEAPETIVLTGVVLRADGQPLPGAGVYVAGAAKQVVVTDEHGAFSLSVPGGRTVALQADYFGLGSTRVSVALPVSKPLRLTIGN